MSKPTYEVIKRYREKSLRRIQVDLKAELVEQWEKKLLLDGRNKSEFIRSAIEAYLNAPKT